MTDSGTHIVQMTAPQNTDKAVRMTRSAIRAVGEGRMEWAAERLVKAVEADPAYGPAHNTLGLIHYDAGNLYQAVLAFEEALQYMPHDPDVHFNLALALEAAGRVDDAEELYLAAVAMHPTNPNYLGNLVRLRIRRGESGPHIDAMLRDLILIETRHDWRAWADRLLALDRNEALDRGPPVPDFNTLTETEKSKPSVPLDERIIDLSDPDETFERIEPADGNVPGDVMELNDRGDAWLQSRLRDDAPERMPLTSPAPRTVVPNPGVGGPPLVDALVAPYAAETTSTVKH